MGSEGLRPGIAMSARGRGSTSRTRRMCSRISRVRERSWANLPGRCHSAADGLLPLARAPVLRRLSLFVPAVLGEHGHTVLGELHLGGEHTVRVPFPGHAHRTSLAGRRLGPERAVLVPLAARSVLYPCHVGVQADDGIAQTLLDLAGEEFPL